MIETGLKRGEKVIISDLVPAIDGMLLTPITDTQTLERLTREATATHREDITS